MFLEYTYYTVTLSTAALRWFPSIRVRLSSPSTTEHLAVAQLSLIQFCPRLLNLSRTESIKIRRTWARKITSTYVYHVLTKR